MAGRPKTTLMRWTVRSSLRYRYLVVVLGALTMVLGIITLPSARVDVFPEFAPPRVVVQTACLGLSTSDVEQLVSVPLEQAFNGDRGPGRAAVQVGAAAVVGRADLRLRRRSAARAPAGRRAHVCGQRHTADLGRAAGDAGPGLGDRAGDADRDDVEGPLASSRCP